MECFNKNNYMTSGFTDIFPDVDTFVNEYLSLDEGLKKMSEKSVRVLYFLLYGRYGNTPIAGNDETVFKYKMYMIMFSDGPIWEKRLEIQDKIRKLSLDDPELFNGGKAIYNRASNDSSSIPNNNDEELKFVDSQNTTKYKKSKLDGYQRLYDMIENDFTKFFLEKFKILFDVVIPNESLWFCSEV